MVGWSSAGDDRPASKPGAWAAERREADVRDRLPEQLLQTPGEGIPLGLKGGGRGARVLLPLLLQGRWAR